jgi:glycosyltransferase involved in cell wall biosynthesis
MSKHLLINASNVSSPGAISLSGSLFRAFATSSREFRFTLLASEPVAMTIPDRWPRLEVVTVPRSRILRSLGRAFFEYRTLASIIRTAKPDALLALGNIAPKATTVPVTVLLQHLLFADTSLPAAPPAIGRMSLAVNRFLLRRTARHARAIIVQTAHMQSLTHENYGVPLERIHVVQNNVSPLITSLTDPPQQGDGRRTSHDAGNPLQLIYPAAPYPYKNIELILRLAADIKASNPVLARFALTLDESTGRGRSIMRRVRREHFEDVVQNLGILDQEALARQYAKSSALFFPSLAESFGNPLLEAACFGLPVLAPNLPYAHDVMADSALYFDPHDVSSAVEAIQSLCDPVTWTDYSRRARNRFESTPTWQEIGDRFLDIVSSTIRH